MICMCAHQTKMLSHNHVWFYEFDCRISLNLFLSFWIEIFRWMPKRSNEDTEWIVAPSSLCFVDIRPLFMHSDQIELEIFLILFSYFCRFCVCFCVCSCGWVYFSWVRWRENLLTYQFPCSICFNAIASHGLVIVCEIVFPKHSDSFSSRSCLFFSSFGRQISIQLCGTMYSNLIATETFLLLLLILLLQLLYVVVEKCRLWRWRWNDKLDRIQPWQKQAMRLNQSRPKYNSQHRLQCHLLICFVHIIFDEYSFFLFSFSLLRNLALVLLFSIGRT